MPKEYLAMPSFHLVMYRQQVGGVLAVAAAKKRQ
jgi:hypothetical protein